MSSTAYQRATADMKAAGLNPMLAYQQGGASAPSGGSFQPSNVVGGALNSALSLAQTAAQVDQITEQTNLLKSQQDTQKTVQALNLANADATSSSAKKTRAGMPKLVAEQDVYKKAPWLPWLDAILGRTGELVGTAKNFSAIPAE